jgi:Holliday junction resolvase RusA-like endonuclease
MTTILSMPFPPSTNNLFINTGRGRIHSSKYDEWITAAGWELKRQRASHVAGPVTLAFEFEEGRDNRKRDISNLIKAPEDLLVRHGVITADDGSVVREISMRWSRSVKGCQVTITPVQNRVPENQTDGAQDDARRQPACGTL